MIGLHSELIFVAWSFAFNVYSKLQCSSIVPSSTQTYKMRLAIHSAKFN